MERMENKKMSGHATLSFVIEKQSHLWLVTQEYEALKNFRIQGEIVVTLEAEGAN